VPGLLLILLETVVINCGGLKAEVKGTATGQIEKYTEGTDVESFVVSFKAKPLPCAEADKLCKELLGKGLRAEAGKGEEEAQEVTEDTNTYKEMVLIDF
jgi:hypothetical protein